MSFKDLTLCYAVGEVSDSDSGGGSDDESAPEEFFDGYGEDLMGDEEDRKRLEQMTEKEREQELYNRLEKREALKTRFEIEKKLRQAKKIEKKKAKKIMDSVGPKSVSQRSQERRQKVEINKKDNKKVSALDELKAKREEKKKQQGKIYLLQLLQYTVKIFIILYLIDLFPFRNPATERGAEEAEGQ